MAVRSALERVISYSPDQQTSSVDDRFEPIGTGTTTSAGAADGTTLIDAGGIAVSGSADTYNGRYLVKCTSGNNENLWAKVGGDNGSGTLTFEGVGFPNQVASGDEYALYKTTECVAVVTTGGAANSFTDTVRAEANDYWIGYWATPITGSNAGEIIQVSDSTGGGLISFGSSFSSNFTAGDVVLLRQFIEAGNVSLTLGEEYHPRLSKRQNYSSNDGVIGARNASVTFDVQAVASGTLAADTNIANKSVLHGLFQACGLSEFVGTTTKIDDLGAAGTTTSLKIDTGTHENFKIGQAIMWAGNVAFITAKTDGAGSADTLTVSPALAGTPLDNNVIYASRAYYWDTDAQQRGVTLYFERDGIRETLYECKGNLEIVVGDKSEVIFRFAFTGVHWTREIEDEQSNPNSAYSTAKILHGKDRLVYLDTTAADVMGLTTTPQAVATAKPTAGRYGVNGFSGLQHTDFAPGATFTQLWEDTDDGLDADEMWGTRTSKALNVVVGSHGDCIAFRIPTARITSAPSPTEQDNLIAQPYVVTGHDAGTVTDPTNGTEKLPDWILCIF